MFAKSFTPLQRVLAQSSVIVITTSGPWVCPPGVYRGKLTLTGAGANSGTSTGGPSTAGPGAGTAIKWLDLVPGATYSIAIGAIGALAGAGTNTGPVSGGTSTFSGPNVQTITANGGQSSGAGGTATGGDVNINGSAAPTASPSAGLNYQNGGSSFLSGAAQNGSAAAGFGAGGASASAGAAANAGYSGVAIIEV